MDDKIFELDQKYRAWRHTWAAPLERWLAINRADKPDFSKMIGSVLELTQLAMNLLKDPSIRGDDQQTLMKALDYVLNEHDALPEAELGPPGLVDDAIQLAVALDKLSRLYGRQFETNWSGKGELAPILEFIVSHKDQYGGGT